MTSPWYEWIDVGGRYTPDQPGYVHKFQRAVAHLNAITQDVGDFQAAGLHTSVGTELESDENGWIILKPGPVKETPGVWPLYLGDFLTNARASLDYLVYDLVRSNKNDPGSHTSFPICDSEPKWKEIVSEREPKSGPAPTAGMAEDAVALIHDEQPLRHRNQKARQNDPLMQLLRMCNADKHRHLHAAAFHTGKVQKVWAEPEGLVEIWRFQAAAIEGPVEGDREIARVKVRPVPQAVPADPQTQIYFGYVRAVDIAFSEPGKPWVATMDDLFGIINSIMGVGRRLESKVEPESTWFRDLFAGRIGGGHRAPRGAEPDL